MNRQSFESVDVESIVGEENMGVVGVIEECDTILVAGMSCWRGY